MLTDHWNRKANHRLPLQVLKYTPNIELKIELAVGIDITENSELHFTIAFTLDRTCHTKTRSGNQKHHSPWTEQIAFTLDTEDSLIPAHCVSG
jgi:hypothetical protein